MKDSHDHATQDMGTLHPSFTLYPHTRGLNDHYSDVEIRRLRAIQLYLHEKPYLREALRRKAT